MPNSCTTRGIPKEEDEDFIDATARLEHHPTTTSAVPNKIFFFFFFSSFSLLFCVDDTKSGNDSSWWSSSSSSRRIVYIAGGILSLSLSLSLLCCEMKNLSHTKWGKKVLCRKIFEKKKSVEKKKVSNFSNPKYVSVSFFFFVSLS